MAPFDMSLFADVVDKIAVPIVAFDADVSVTLLNKAYVTMMDLPPELTRPGTSFAAILRYNWQRDYYPGLSEEEAVDRWLGALHTGMDHGETITRPDGSVYVVEKRLLSDGGWVLTYVDLTESTQKQMALEASQARYRGIVEDQTEMISRFDADCTLSFVNSAYCQAFGFEREDLIGRDFTQCIPDPDTRVKIKKAVRGLSWENPVISGEYLEKNADGTNRWRHWTDRALFDSERNIIEYQGVGRDVTTQREAEIALRESERRFRAIVEDQTEFIMRFQPQTYELTFVNAAYCRHMGFAPEDVIGQPLWVLLHPDSRDAVHQKLQSLTRIAPEATSETRYFNAESVEVVEQWTDRALFDETGQVVEYQSVGRDITEQAIAQAALTRSEQRFKGIAESHPVPVVILRQADRTVLYASPAAVQLLAPQGRPGALRGQRLAFENGAEAALFEAAAQSGVLDGFLARLRGSDRGVIPVEITARRMDYDGHAALSLGVTDITERQKAETEIQRQRDALAQSEKMNALGSLLASVAHELNNPLAVILAQAEIASEQASQASDRDRAERIKVAAQRCSRIVKTFLAMARQKPSGHEEVDLNVLVHNAIELVGYALRTAGVEVELDLATQAPIVAGDPDQLMQVVVNLVINAQQAMVDVDGPRAIHLTTKTLSDDTVALTVRDTGPGVSPDVADRIFEPFFTTKEEGAGTGIGLSVCSNIVEGHGGSLSLGTKLGPGASFVIRLPVGQSAPAAFETPVEMEDLPPLKVLAIDDEVDLTISIAEMLVPDGHDVVVSQSALEALDILDEEEFDLILSDIRMPGMDGLQFHRRLRDAHPAMALRIGFVTGDTLSGLSRRLMQESGCPVLEKPFDKKDVLTLMHRIRASDAKRSA